MKIWTITYNDDNGAPDCAVFTTAEAAEAAEREWLQAYKEDFPEVDYTQSSAEIFGALCESLGFFDSCTIQEHTVQQPETTDAVERAYLIQAQGKAVDGETEVDSNAVVSMGEDPGAYVQAWVWIADDEVQTPMVIDREGTIWYFDDFKEFLEAWEGVDGSCSCRLGEPGDLEASEGANDAWEFLTSKDDSLKLRDLTIPELQEEYRNG